MTMPSAQEGRFRFGDKIPQPIDGKQYIFVRYMPHTNPPAIELLCDKPECLWMTEDELAPYLEHADSPGPTQDHDAPPTPGERCSDCWGSGELYSLPLTGYPVTCRLCGGTGKVGEERGEESGRAGAQHADVAELVEAAKAVCAIKSEMDEAPKGKSIEASLNDFFQNHHKRMMAMFCGIDRMKIAVDAMQVSGPKPENNTTER